MPKKEQVFEDGVVQHHQPRHPPIGPADPFDSPSVSWLDATQLSEKELETIAGSTLVPRLQAVWVRRGLWHPLVLTGWCPLERGEWAAQIQARSDTEPRWLRYRGASLQPILPMDGLPPGDLAELSRRTR